MTHIEKLAFAQNVISHISESGAFLLTGEKSVNPMTIGWAGAAWMWSQPTLLVVVRQSRFTHALMDTCDAFTVSVPAAGSMGDELNYCGTVSGRDKDKMRELGMGLLPPQAGQIGGLKGCELHVECRALYRMEGALELMDSGVRKKWYPDGDPHTLYFGEILAAYRS